MICGTRSGEGRRKQHRQRRQNKPRTICLRRLTRALNQTPMCQHRLGLAGPSSRSFLSARHQQHFVFSYSRQHHGSWQRDYLVHPPESGNYTVTETATSGSLSHTTMITVESGSGSAGGVVLPDDKLRLLLDYIPTLSLIPVVLAVGAVGLWRSKRRRENRASFRWLPGP